MNKKKLDTLIMKKSSLPCKTFILSITVFILSTYSCKNDNKKPVPTNEPPVVRLNVPAIAKDSAYAYVKAQVDFGARVPGTPAHILCGDWIVAKCKSFGAEVIEQPFDGQTYTGIKFKARNIIASYQPAIKKRILLAAHWDTRFESDHDPDKTKQKKPVMGADDGASGVGILLEVARQIQLNPMPNLGIDLLFLDAEDQGSDGGTGEDDWCLGAQYWSKNKHIPGYKAKYGILLDMVGARSPRYTKDGTSVNFAPDLVDKVWTLAQRMGYGNSFVNDHSSAITDDHLYINKLAGIPMIDLINRPTNEKFPAHHHTTQDVLSVIDADALKATGQVVLAVIYREANGEF
ncbi:MAG: M28 family peptidase [Saprospiraceae bacterium]